MSRNLIFFLMLLACLLMPFPSHAYNFLYIHPTTGQPIGWEPGTTIHYWLDPGPLGRLTNEQAHTLLKEAMKIWENASPYADVPHFEFGGYLPEDVDGGNYQDYVSLFSCYTDDLSLCRSQSQRDLRTVIVFDEEGVILDNELCRIGGCGATSGARVFSGSSANPTSIVQGIAVFGGGVASSRISAIVGTFVHELGHLLGLAHTSLNQQVFLSETLTQQNHVFLPTMEAIGTDASVLNPDDIAGISVLYPSETFSQNTGTIKGQILKSDGAPMMHVNVIARNVDDPLCEAYSFLSGRLCEHTQIGEYCLSDNSNYTISSLPTGTYTIEAEEVADENLAFTLAPGLIDPFISGDAEFWNENDQASELNTFSSPIVLIASESKENINIILNRSIVTDGRVKYIPLDTFTSGPGTRCPDEPSVNYAELVGIDESTGDSGGTNGNSSTGSTAPVTGGCSLTPQG